MDKKLLLAIQYACNTSGVAVPWDKVGVLMGPEISPGAVIQHLAKVRVRMVELGLSVPPPLRRGGSGRSTNATSTPKKLGVAKVAKTKSIKKKTKPQSDDSDEQEDWKNDDSDLDFGQPRAKRTKSNAKGSNGRTIKKEDSHDEDASDGTNEEFVATGAGFLALENDHGSPETAKNTPSTKKSLIVALPSTAGGIKEEDVDMSANEREAEATGGGVARGQSYGDYSSSPYNQELANLAAAQMEPATGPINTSSYGGTYNNFDHTGPQVSTFVGGLYHPNQPLFQQAGDNLDFDIFNPGAEVPIDFNSDEYLNNVGVINTGTDGNGTYNGTAQDSTCNYQPTNAYHDSPAVFDNNHYGHLPLTHWSNDNSFAGSSMATTANQTPAENSAGTDFGGYFANAQFQADAFDGATYDPSASHGMGSLNMAYVPDAFSNEYYGNGSYLD